VIKILTYIKGDLFSSPAQVLVNTVNTVGVMGRGIALEFKNRYPEMFKIYQKKCENKSIDIGKLFLWKKEEKWVLLFPTKKHWRYPSQIAYIEEGLKKFANIYDKLGIESIAFPRLGCGNGGLDWNEVRPIMEKYLKNLPIHIYIYIDKYEDSIPEYKQPKEMEKWLKSNPKSMGFLNIKEDLQHAIKLNNNFLINGSELKHISWQSNEIILVNGHEIRILEEEMSEFWDYIRDVGIVDIEKLPERFSKYGLFMLDILRRLDYVKPIIISANGIDFNKYTNGFQYIR
jgi:O-acetyl-ADP-ribose deacetylase (regulator of RNase III)